MNFLIILQLMICQREVLLHCFQIQFLIYFCYLGERELVEFLTEEILAEKKAQKIKTIPSEFEGFSVKLNGAEVTLSKKAGDET